MMFSSPAGYKNYSYPLCSNTCTCLLLFLVGIKVADGYISCGDYIFRNTYIHSKIILKWCPHNCIATADRAVVVFVKEFRWDQRPNHLKTNSFPLTQNYYIYFLFLAIPGDEPQLFLITFSVQNIRGAIYPSGSRVSKSGRGHKSCEKSNLLKSFFYS